MQEVWWCEGNNVSFYIQKAVNLGYITSEEANLIAGYEIVRSDRTGNKSIIGKGLLYNMKYYVDVNPSTNIAEQILYYLLYVIRVFVDHGQYQKMIA